jgi:RES domain-containing protein
MRLWRLVKTRFASTAFDGEGARLHGARWNSPGTRVAYASSNSALAVLEVLVHMTGGGTLPAYSLITATLPDSLVEDLPASELPKNWASSPVPPAVQAIGDAWIRSGRSLALRVPSALVDDSHNFLINPEHADFAQFTVESSEPFGFDPRD